MLLAVTYDNGEVFQHFGKTPFFKLYNIIDGEILQQEVVSTDGQGHGALAAILNAYGVDALFCGGIGPGAVNALAQIGIKCFPGVEGNADEAVNSFLKGELMYDPNASCNHHHDDGNCSHEHCCH